MSNEPDIIGASNHIDEASDFMTALYMSTYAIEESEDASALRAVAGAAIDSLIRAWKYLYPSEEDLCSNVRKRCR